LTNKQATIIVISVLCAAALLIGLLVILGPVLGGNNADPHAGHNHGSSNLGDGHYEGDGHDHGSSGSKVKYQIYQEKGGTYCVVFRDAAGKSLAELKDLKKMPIKSKVDEEKGVYELGWANDNGPNDFECVYFNEKTGEVSEKFTAPRGTDGARIAYGSEDQKKIIVRDLFNKDSYSKEYTLEGASANKNGDIIMGGSLSADGKTVTISYLATADGKQESRHLTVKLYE
jgi:hypothetical protein